MKRVAIVSLDNQDIHTDARVQRQVQYLSRIYEVHVVTYGKSEIASDLPACSISYVGTLTREAWKRQLLTLVLLPLGRLFGRLFYELWYWSRPGHKKAVSLIQELHVDFVHANDWWSLPVAVRATEGTSAKIVFDMHEYSPDEYSSLWWRMAYRPAVLYFFKQYLRYAQATVTVNKILAERYNQEFNINSIVVMNAPQRSGDPVNSPVDKRNIRLVHQGYAVPSRKLETMIDVVSKCDSRYSLSFILVGNARYINRLKNYSQNMAAGRVHFLPGMKPHQLISKLREFDIGLFITCDTHFSTLTSLPNKFFEFVSAGLAVCIGPSPAMAELVSQYQFGVVAPSFRPEEVAEMLNSLLPEDIDNLKSNAIAAREILNADVELAKLIHLYQQLEIS